MFSWYKDNSLLLLLFHHQFIRFNNKQTSKNVHVKKYLAFDLEKYLEFVPYSVLHLIITLIV